MQAMCACAANARAAAEGKGEGERGPRSKGHEKFARTATVARGARARRGRPGPAIGPSTDCASIAPRGARIRGRTLTAEEAMVVARAPGARDGRAMRRTASPLRRGDRRRRGRGGGGAQHPGTRPLSGIPGSGSACRPASAPAGARRPRRRGKRRRTVRAARRTPSMRRAARIRAGGGRRGVQLVGQCFFAARAGRTRLAGAAVKREADERPRSSC